MAEGWRCESAAPTGPTIADGVAVAVPARLEEIVAVVIESGGAVVTVSDDEIRAAQRVLAETGLYAEPTGALAAAGYLAHAAERRPGAAGKSAAPGPRHTPGPRHAPGETAVVFLTGSGLKEQS